jgi:hypothetical protein
MSAHKVNGWIAVCDGCGKAIVDERAGGVMVAEVYNSREEAEEGVVEAGFLFINPVMCNAACAAANQPGALRTLDRAADYFRTEFMVDGEAAS